MSLLLAISCGSDDDFMSGGNDDGNANDGGTVSVSTTKIEVDTSTEYQTIDSFEGINHPIWRGDFNETDRVKVFGKGRWITRF